MSKLPSQLGCFAWLAVVAAVGCVGPQRAIEKAVYCAEAKHAYKRCGDCGLGCELSRHYERGWRRGYVAVSIGRGDCPPPLPPHPYLGKRYQSPQGQELVSLWFKGWEEGAAAARGCGRGPQVLTHEVGCRGGCEDACLNPGLGVLPDAELVVALQAASYEAPVVAPPVPVEPPVGESVPAVEVAPPGPESNGAGIPSPGEASSPIDWSEVEWTSWPSVGGLEYPAETPLAAPARSAYEPSPTTPLSFPEEPKSLPPVSIRSIAAPVVASPEREAGRAASESNVVTSAPPERPAARAVTGLAFPAEASQPVYRRNRPAGSPEKPLRLPALGATGPNEVNSTPVALPKRLPPSESLTPVSLPKPSGLEYPVESGELPAFGVAEDANDRPLLQPEVQ